MVWREPWERKRKGLPDSRVTSTGGGGLGAPPNKTMCLSPRTAPQRTHQFDLRLRCLELPSVSNTFTLLTLDITYLPSVILPHHNALPTYPPIYTSSRSLSPVPETLTPNACHDRDISADKTETTPDCQVARLVRLSAPPVCSSIAVNLLDSSRSIATATAVVRASAVLTESHFHTLLRRLTSSKAIAHHPASRHCLIYQLSQRQTLVDWTRAHLRLGYTLEQFAVLIPSQRRSRDHKKDGIENEYGSMTMIYIEAPPHVYQYNERGRQLGGLLGGEAHN